MLESRLVENIRKALKTKYPDSWWMKIHGGPYQTSGIPDLIGCAEGIFFALEVKLPEGKYGVTKRQQYHIDKIIQAGGTAAVVRSVTEALDVIRERLQA